MTDPSFRAELLELNQRLLESIAAGDWKTYQELCHPELTCFEPEARGQLIEGMNRDDCPEVCNVIVL